MKSRCTEIRHTSLTWEDYFDFYNESFIAYKSWLLELPQYPRELLEADISTRREAAASGRLTEEATKTFEAVRTQPGLFELKWETKQRGVMVQIRQYHGEPDESPEVLVATHMHIKDLSGSDSEILARQDSEMNFAQVRFIEWKNEL